MSSSWIVEPEHVAAFQEAEKQFYRALEVLDIRGRVGVSEERMNAAREMRLLATAAMHWAITAGRAADALEQEHELERW